MKKFLIASAAAVFALLGTAAHAGGHVDWSVNVGVGYPGAVVYPAPVYAPPPPVVYAPPPPVVYAPPPVYGPPPVYAPPPVYVRPAPVYAPAYYGAPVEYRVAPGHHRHRHQRCDRHGPNACAYGRPVVAYGYDR